jgi:hypothetical protein
MMIMMMIETTHNAIPIHPSHASMETDEFVRSAIAAAREPVAKQQVKTNNNNNNTATHCGCMGDNGHRQRQEPSPFLLNHK